MPDSEVDILISRIIDGVATPADWRAFELLAARDPAAWRDLAMGQRDDRSLRAAVAACTAHAEHVNLPARDSERAAHRVVTRTRHVAAWAGWAAAAAVGFAFLSTRAPDLQGRHNPATAGLGAPVETLATAADALSEYVAKGQREGTVIREVPEKWLLGTQPSPDGRGQQVIYLRLIMEQTNVPDFYKFSQDEWGNPVPARVRLVQPQEAPVPARPVRVRPPV